MSAIHDNSSNRGTSDKAQIMEIGSPQPTDHHPLIPKLLFNTEKS
jgi:hypothetical protein